MDNLKNSIYDRIGEGDVEGAIDLLMKILEDRKDSKTYKEALFLKSNLHSAKQQYEIKGVIARQEYELIVNKTLLGLESLLDEVGDQATEVKPLPEKMKETTSKKKPSSAGLLLIGLAIVLIIVLFTYGNLQKKISVSKEDRVAESINRWREGDFRNVREDLEILRQWADPEKQEIASERLHWLGEVGEGPFYLIANFEELTDTSMWHFSPGYSGKDEPDYGEYRLLPRREGGVLQLQGHEHAAPDIAIPIPERRPVEVQFRFRMVSDEPVDFHVNLCMDLPPPFPRTTIGIYQEASVVNIWERMESPEQEGKRPPEVNFLFRKDDWHHLRVLVTPSGAEVFMDGKELFNYESERGNLSLSGFNLESIVGTLEVDNLLIRGV